MKKCPFCAEEIQDQALVCRFCGRNLSTAHVQKVEIDYSKSNRNLLILVGVIFAILGICVLFFIIGANNLGQ